MAINKEELIKEIESMSVLELNELVKALEEKFGVSAAMPMMMAGGAAPAAGAAAEEKTSFDVILSGAGDKKIQVIKVIRELTNLGLKEAKDIADTAPKPVKTGVAKDEAEKMKAKLEEAGATVELK
jgi:large subunit ribosomal protein L7/L12